MTMLRVLSNKVANVNGVKRQDKFAQQLTIV